MMTEEAYSQYTLKRISLVKSVFEVSHYSYEPSQGLSLKVDVKHQENENSVVVLVNVSLFENEEKANNLILNVTMAGDFEFMSQGGEASDIHFSDFVNVNGPAIIYPYVRQHIRNLSLDAGFKQPIILPILNFVKLAEKAKERSSS